MKKNNHRDKQSRNLQTYIDQLSDDSKPILTYVDIDEKMKSGAFQRTFLEPLPKWLKIILTVVVTGSIVYGLIENLVVSFQAAQ